MAKLPTIAAYAYKKSIGQPFLYPNNTLDLIENFLTMMFAVPSEPYEVSPTIVHALKVLLILHADHEQNCSTSTVRLVGLERGQPLRVDRGRASTRSGVRCTAARTRPSSRCSSRSATTAATSTKYVAKAKDPDDPFRLSGFGHRVYKNYDPRARILKGIADQVLERARRARRAPRPRARSSRRSRSTTSTSSSASCTRTSTSTPVSSTGRWASPPTCSRCCSRSAASPAGSRTGRR